MLPLPHSMKKAIVTLIPCAVSVLYALAQLIAHSATGRMYFTSSFASEVMLYITVGLMYVYAAFSVNRSKYLRFAVFGLTLGLLVFIAVSAALFLTFEFSRDLSI